jgi:hypothetical protein
MRWRRRRKAEPVDHGHRLRDNDAAPMPGYRTYRRPHGWGSPTDDTRPSRPHGWGSPTDDTRPSEILNGPTRELPVIDTNDPLRMTPGQEHRSGRRRWLP